MPQRPKESVRRAIVEAARALLAEHGLAGTTASEVADRAGTSVGNLYKYFANKDELFAAAIPEAIVSEVRTLLCRQVEALGIERDVEALPSDHPYHRVRAQMLRFAIEHRHELAFLLRRADGTAYASVPEELVSDFVRLAIGYAKRAYPEFPWSSGNRRALRRIYRAYLHSIADVLDEERSPRALSDATARLMVYHLSGLRGFFSTHAGLGRKEAIS